MLELEKGKILISEPYIADDNFFRSVILIANYDKEEGAVGFMLNQITDATLEDVILSENFPAIPLYDGGPVELDSLFFIHTIPGLQEDSVLIKDQLYWGGNFDLLAPSILEGSVTEENIKLFIGYSGWEAGQLEAEINAGSWFVSDLDIEDVINASDDDLWKYSVENLNGKDKIWANAPLNPLLN